MILTTNEGAHTKRDGGGVDEIVSALQDIQDGDGDDKDELLPDGIIQNRLTEVQSMLLEFGKAIGGDPKTVQDLPFTEEARRDGMPEPLYVRHDDAMLDQVTSWLLQGQHIGLISPYGTGKSAFREIVRRDLGNHDSFIVTSLANAQQTTTRKLFETIIRAGTDAGYEIDEDDYWQVRNGIPWSTEGAKQAVAEISEKVQADNKKILLVIDEMEDFDPDLLAPLQTAADAGVRLFLLGTPDAANLLKDTRETLTSRLRFYEQIATFDPDDIDEYIARSLAYFRGNEYNGQDQNLYTRDAVVDIHKRTGGNPREVRLECRELFVRAGFIWYRTDCDLDRLNITPALRHRKLALG